MSTHYTCFLLAVLLAFAVQGVNIAVSVLATIIFRDAKDYSFSASGINL